jgi:hypothetical protein
VLSMGTVKVSESVTFRRFSLVKSLSHFKDFGCRCFILKKGRLDKFESRSSDKIFFGYASDSRAFRVLNLDTNLVRCQGFNGPRGPLGLGIRSNPCLGIK